MRDAAMAASAKAAARPNDEAIDAVVCWVDGTDPAHRRKRARYSTDGYSDEGFVETRFRQCDEIRYCLISLIRFAPFLRKIFIVTDDQRPTALNDVFERFPHTRDVVEIVDHERIFAGCREYLPTFNSIAIESRLHLIPGLSERFVYLNDDFFLGRKIEAGNWFDREGPVLRGRMRPFYEQRLSYRLKRLLDFRGARERRPGFITSQQRAARLVGASSGFLQVGHHPHPLRRSTLERVFEAHAGLMDVQLRHRFRHPEQVSVVGLANHCELRSSWSPTVLDPPAVGYFKPNHVNTTSVARFDAELRDGQYHSVCIQSMDLLSAQNQAALRDVLDRYYVWEAPVASASAGSVTKA